VGGGRGGGGGGETVEEEEGERGLGKKEARKARKRCKVGRKKMLQR